MNDATANLRIRFRRALSDLQGAELPATLLITCSGGSDSAALACRLEHFRQNQHKTTCGLSIAESTL